MKTCRSGSRYPLNIEIWSDGIHEVGEFDYLVRSSQKMD